MSLAAEIVECGLCSKNKGVPRTLGPTNWPSKLLFLRPSYTDEVFERDGMTESFETFKHMFERVTTIDFGEVAYMPIQLCSGKMKSEYVRNCREAYIHHYMNRATTAVFLGSKVYASLFEEGSLPETLYGHGIKEPKFKCNLFFMSDVEKLPALDETSDFFGNREGEYWYVRIQKELSLLSSFLRKHKE